MPCVVIISMKRRTKILSAFTLVQDVLVSTIIIVNFTTFSFPDDELNYPEPDNYLEELQAPAEK